MKIKGITLLNPNFVPALEKLLGKEMPIADCVALSEAVGEIEKHIETVQKARKGLIDRYVEKDESGASKITRKDDTTEVQFKSQEDRVAFAKDVEELGNQEFDIRFDTKIVISKDEKMSPRDYLLIKDFVEIK